LSLFSFVKGAKHMSLTEKYIWYQRGIVKRNVPEKLQEFFKTKPTNEQLIILDEITQDNNRLENVAIVFLFGLGMLTGGILVYYYCYIQTLLGLPF
jgi:hypothetical protein